MISMRYGAVAIANKTGGLNDSVFYVDDDAIPLQFCNGFTIVTADEQEVRVKEMRKQEEYLKQVKDRAPRHLGVGVPGWEGLSFSLEVWFYEYFRRKSYPHEYTDERPRLGLARTLSAVDRCEIGP
ncbi:hypothetical protein IFM89_023119 [Coptis chinensis]|uniref:starch synthase n=1 Tax=Coptis chinensis TaxID=261450 RepID=A0A835HWQ9_9MAGN|nr:hypothetical protein IFM89_023119 [Coptis chinensis]